MEMSSRERVVTALRREEPDRVPVVLTTNYFPARYLGGLHVSDSYYNHETWRDATLKTILELEPDIQGAQAGGPGNALAGTSNFSPIS